MAEIHYGKDVWSDWEEGDAEWYVEFDDGRIVSCWTREEAEFAAKHFDTSDIQLSEFDLIAIANATDIPETLKWKIFIVVGEDYTKYRKTADQA